MKKIILIVLFLILGTQVVSFAAPGDLDSTFGTNGIVITDFGGNGSSHANTVLLQPDGMILAAGEANIAAVDFALARYNVDGSLDAGFNGDGLVNSHFSTGDDEINALLLQSDGSILAAGCCGADGDFAILRYQTGGDLDTDFGTNGSVSTEAGSIGSGGARVFVLQEDGSLWVAGFVGVSPNRDFAIAHYRADGSLDTSFDSDGEVTTDLGSNDLVRALAIQEDGRIVAAGTTGVSPTIDMAVVRYNTDGSLDSSFGSGGRTTIDFGGSDTPGALALQSDGRIVVVGTTGTPEENFALARLNTDGSPDTGFGTGGLVTNNIGGDDFANAVAIQEDGKIVVGGESDSGGNDDFALARYNSDGSVDTTFSTDGHVTTDLGDILDYALAVALQEDGRIILAGVMDNNDTEDFGMVRYLGDTADLALTLAASDDSPQVDETVTYTITVTNNGPDSAGEIEVTNTLPAEITLNSGSITNVAGSWTCSGTTALECLLTALASGASASFTFTVTVNASGSISNSATVSGQVSDATSSNNTATVVITVSVPSAPSGGGCQLVR